MRPAGLGRSDASCGSGAAGQRRPVRGQRRQGQAPRSADLMKRGQRRDHRKSVAVPIPAPCVRCASPARRRQSRHGTPPRPPAMTARILAVAESAESAQAIVHRLGREFEGAVAISTGPLREIVAAAAEAPRRDRSPRPQHRRGERAGRAGPARRGRKPASAAAADPLHGRRAGGRQPPGQRRRLRPLPSASRRARSRPPGDQRPPRLASRRIRRRRRRCAGQASACARHRCPPPAGRADGRGRRVHASAGGGDPGQPRRRAGVRERRRRSPGTHPRRYGPTWC